MIPLLAFLFGLLIGSFLNVCIYRWPRDLSVVRPRSHCAACGKTIAWYDNIPLLSYLLLRGRCRHCAARIPARYPIVELMTALLFLYLAATLEATPALAVKMCVFAAIMTALMFCDLEQRILPDELTLGGMAAGLIFAFVAPIEDSMVRAVISAFGPDLSGRAGTFVEALAGAIVPSSFLWLAGWIYERVRHREGLGFGDVKLIAMAGAFLGIRGALATLFWGSIAGSVLGYAYIKIRRKDPATYELPFGTFLAAAALITSLIGPL